MPHLILDYPDAYARWNALSSFGSYISVVGICRFFVVVTITSSSGMNKRCAPSPWAVKQNPTTPEWMVQSPPAFYTFGELQAIKEMKSYVKCTFKRECNISEGAVSLCYQEVVGGLGSSLSIPHRSSRKRKPKPFSGLKRVLLAASPASYYGGYVFVEKMNEKRDEHAIFKSIDRYPNLF
ncbi:cytochrome c oxidase subunit 1 [Capsicum baccatum]|uniref:Cytochrome c oxidase subunit 1 n=1 Tax=Capsicum baccatum TaxID=33114 RepID=A0A2G2WAJ1_CAPBA|nr:cytochrome c oxidase subunit 1 [Capsicum baccatum]